MLVGPLENNLLLVSNRGPISYGRDEAGALVANRGSGGLVTALLGVAAGCDVTWIAGAMTPEDAEMSAGAGGDAFSVASEGVDLKLRFVTPDATTRKGYYSVIANPMLWFIQHNLWNLPLEPRIGRKEAEAWEGGYLAVNRMFADAVVEELEGRGGERPLVMLQDYHLYVCPAYIREQRPDAFLHQFIHIPWPQPDAWRVLPGAMRETVFAGLLANDIIGFHTARYARNFLRCSEELLGLKPDYATATLAVDGRQVLVRHYPVSVDCEDFERLAGSEPVLAEEQGIIDGRREFLILRVDRIDLSKNIVRGFMAYDLFLAEHPELHERVTFLALLQPSREDIPQYAAYRDQVIAAAAAVNARHGTSGWEPVDLRLQDNFHCSVAAYKQYDVLMVNPVFDGMNLIAKEASLVNRRGGVLILSENAGVHEQLGEHAVSVNPFSLEEQSRAIHRALTMAEDEKQVRLGRIKEAVRGYDVHRWVEAQFDDIREKIAAGG